MNLDSALRLLGLESGSTLQDIKRAYKRRIRVCHPDKFHNDPVMAREAEAQTKLLNAAYEFLVQHVGARFDRGTPGFNTEPKRPRPQSSFYKAIRIFRETPDFAFGDPSLYRYHFGDYVFGAILGSALFVSLIAWLYGFLNPSTRAFTFEGLVLVFVVLGIGFTLFLLPSAVLAVLSYAINRRI